MSSRRSFVKILAGIGAFLLPWTVLPTNWKHKLENILGEPSVDFGLSLNVKQGLSYLNPEALERKASVDIQALSHLDLQGRRAGTAGETRALVYIQGQVEALNLKSFGDEGYLQMFSIPSMQERRINGRALFRPDEQDSLRMPAANLLAGLPGVNNKETILISAHYDHLGIYEGRLCPGANDNASGVGCLLQVLRRLVKELGQGTEPQKNIVAAFWGAEEMGFLGSQYFVKKPTIPLSEIKAVINYDTVANGAKENFILWSSEKNDLIPLAQEVTSKKGANIKWASGQGHFSDEVAFAKTKIPAITILSEDWLAKNHTPQDDLTLINEEKLNMASEVLYDLIKRLAYS